MNMNVDKAAIVTGASRGIGRAAALALAAEGFDIAAIALDDQERLGTLVTEVEALGRACVSFDLDIGDIDAHEDVLAAITERFGAIDCLVNNAGVSVLSRGDLLDVSAQSYDRCLDINTRGTFFLTQAVAKLMIAQEPAGEGARSIVFVTSSNAVVATIERGEYCMSKSALSMAARLFALRLAPHGIGVFEVQPGLILTEMTAPSKAKYDKLIGEGMTATPRWGQPDDVARVIRTMAAGLLPYTVAQEVRVDGGLMVQRY
jgi:NAD(P)-dependent dehydrogenase (short-subunit alcohol dehydrogenase family)